MRLAKLRDGFERRPLRDPPPLRLAIACGGTAGHVHTGIAIASGFARAFPGSDILLIGTPVGFEQRIVAQTGFRLVLVSGTPFFGESCWGKGLALWNLGVGALQARRVLRDHGVQLVIGTGGYASAGAILAARSLALRAVLHEANAAPGIANRFAARFADRIYLGCASAAAAFPNTPTLFTGTPIRWRARSPRLPNQAPREGRDEEVHILVSGGSTGSPFLNQRTPALLRRVSRLGIELQVLHQAGDEDVESVRRAYREAGIPARVIRFAEAMDEVYSWADFAITCAGALTLAELAHWGLPSLVVPLGGSAGNHQIANAAVYAEATGGWWINERDWSEEAVASRLGALLRSGEHLGILAKRARGFGSPDAVEKLMADCRALLAAG